MLNLQTDKKRRWEVSSSKGQKSFPSVQLLKTMTPLFLRFARPQSPSCKAFCGVQLGSLRIHTAQTVPTKQLTYIMVLQQSHTKVEPCVILSQVFVFPRQSSFISYLRTVESLLSRFVIKYVLLSKNVHILCVYVKLYF